MADYGTVAGFRTYHIARGRTVDEGTYSNARVEAIKLIASDWIDNAYRSMFPGLKVDGRDQVREWPRTGVIDIYGYAVSDSSVPTEILSATYEATLKELETPGVLTKDYTPSKYNKVSIDGALSVEFAQRNVGDVQTQFAIIDQILDTLLGTVANSGPVLSGKTYRG